MKTRLLLVLGMISLFILSSCNEDEIISQNQLVHSISVKGQDFTDGDSGNGTRASYSVDGAGFHFSWAQGDTVGIYPLGGDQVAFPISSGEGSQTAQFDGGAWALRSTFAYAAYYPFSSKNYHIDETHLPVNYLGQSQNGNGSIDGLDHFDYQASVATRPDAEGNINISLIHLGCFVRIQIPMHETDTYSLIELKSSNTPFVTTGTVDLSSDSISITPVSTSNIISINLYNTSTFAEDSVLVVYAMMAPCDLSDSQIKITVIGSDDKKYESLLYGKKMIAGKAYRFNAMQGNDILTFDTIVPPNNEIWYKTTDGTVAELNNRYGFGASVISNTYENGMGIIRFNHSINAIASEMFGMNSDAPKIESFYMPNSVETIYSTAFYNCHSLKEIRISPNVTSLGDQCFMNCYNLEEVFIPDGVTHFGFGIFNEDHNLRKFKGNNPAVSSDGRCLIVDGVLNSIAPYGITEYTIPNGVQTIGYGCFSDLPLTSICFPEGLKKIEARAFDFCTNLKNIDLPEGLLEIGQWAFRGGQYETIHIPSTVNKIGNAVFGRCENIKSFSGKFASDDGLFLVVDGEIVAVAFAGLGKVIKIPNNVKIIGNQIFELGVSIEQFEELILPEGLLSIGDQAFSGWTGLKTVNIPSTVEYLGMNPFEECYNLECFTGKYATDDGRCLIINNELVCVAPGGLTEFTVPDGVLSIGFSVFGDNSPLSVVNLPDGLENISMRAFRYCVNLKSITLPASLKQIYSDAFYGCTNLESVYCKSFVPPVFYDCYIDYVVHPFDCGYSDLKIYVPIQSETQYRKSWPTYSSNISGYDFGIEYDFYISSDYQNDGLTSLLQKSSTGSGIDLILMGDAFSDRQIADGTYSGVMQNAMEAFFSEEPYKSYKNYFNVYTVNVVSMTEGYDQAGQALESGFGEGTFVYGNDKKVIDYAKKAISEDRLDDAAIIVMMNKDAYSGTCYMFDAPDGDYGRGLSIAYFPVNSIPDNFNGLVLHEAGGHGFAKLADEYAYETNGTINYNNISAIRANEQYGWWKNIDFTNDPTQVKWSQFISDSRYVNENIGCYEGGLTYWSGVWRPTENSIMRYNNGAFNAPSRYAIWYRINKLAFGENWYGSYEDFVEYDAINRTSSTVSKRIQSRDNYVEKNLPALAPPVILGHSWREAK